MCVRKKKKQKFFSLNGNGNVDEFDGLVRNGACLEPRVIAKAPAGQGCPRCGGYVYMAEQMLARGRVSIKLFLSFSSVAHLCLERSLSILSFPNTPPIYEFK